VEVDVYIHILLTSALVGCEWSGSRFVLLRPGERVPGTHWIGWVDHRAGVDYVEKRTFDPIGTRTPTIRSSIPRPVAILTALYRFLIIIVIIIYFISNFFEISILIGFLFEVFCSHSNGEGLFRNCTPTSPPRAVVKRKHTHDAINTRQLAQTYVSSTDAHLPRYGAILKPGAAF
jgi:hypothetical protein